MAGEQAIEIVTGDGAPQGSIIWLHGLGADGHDFEPIVPELRLPPELGLRFVFPHAPVRPVTLNGGMAMRAWFDIVSLDRNGPADEAGILASIAELERLIVREQERGIAADRIVIAGFSQGGAIALHTALRTTARLAGVMGLSAYLPSGATLKEEMRASDLPAFMAHGVLDPVLPLALGREAADVLVANGFDVEWHDYPMAHSVCAAEINDIRGWLLAVFGDK